MMLFCGFAANALADPTDLPEMTTDESNPIWYTIKNVRKQKYATYAGDATTMTQSATITTASFFYFTGTVADGSATVKIHNYSASNKLCAAYNSWTDTGINWYIKAQSTGVSICTSTGEWNAWNDARGEGALIEYWSASDAGSAWEIEKVTDFSAILDVNAAKTAAKAKLDSYAAVPAFYPSVDAAKAEIDAIVAADNSLAGLNTAIEEVNAVVVKYLKGAYDALNGKYYSIYTPARANVNYGYMRMNVASVSGVAAVNSPADIWQFVSDNGFVKVFNPYIGKYLGEPGSNSSKVATVDAAGAANYTLEVNASAENADAKIKLTCNGKSVHMDGSGNLVRWDNGGASEWTISEVTDFTDIVTAYKTSALTTLDQWAALTVVFDAATISAAKASINAISVNSWASIAAVDAELKKVADDVASKMFTFQATSTDNHRNGVWVSANMSTSKAIGAHSQDYNAIWSLRHAGGTSFYLYNELNSVYVGKPTANCPLTAEPTTAYTFEIIDAVNGIVEMHFGGETLHASNHADDKLLNWDGNEAASRWYIRTIDVASDIQVILDALTPADYAEVPALGQYPKAAYDALVEARNTAKTVEAVETAIANFKRSKNLPIFTISGVKDYVVGKSIYDDNDGAPNFKTTNKWDKTMWWALDMTSTTVGVTEEVGIYNVGTGNGFWGASSIKITETSENEGAGIPDDGIFLFYTTGNDTPIHYQNDNQVIVRWGTTEANSGSAHIFTYIGNTYDIADITEEEIALIIAKEELDAYIAELGTVDHATVPALGQYTTAAYNALLAAKDAATIEDIEAAINNFKRSKNLPVFMISGVVDYAWNKSIYEREDGELHFQKTDKWDKTMWWVLDMTATSIGVAEKVDIYNYASGNGFLGASSIKITETNPAVETDNIFLFYTTGNDTPVHYQQNDSKIVRWNATGAESASAHVFTYIGTTRDLNGLSDEHLAALGEFRAVYTSSSAYSSVEMGDGVGQYSGDKSLLDAAIAEAQILYDKTDAEKAAMQVSEIEAVTAALQEGVAALSLNMPTAGFYRIVSQNATDDAKRDCYWQVNEAGDAMELNKTQSETRSMFYLSETNQLVNYATGAAINGVTTVDALGTAANSWNITKNNAVLSTYALQFNDVHNNYLSDWTGVSTNGLNDDNAAWKFEPVTVVPVAVTAAGYATFFSPVAVTLPEGVEAYVATATTSNAVGLSIISNKVIPANTGVILVAKPGTYELTVSGEAEEELTSVLKGTVAATYITDESYILAQKNGVVGMYKALFNISTDQTNDGEEGVEDDTYEAFLNNGFKAYLPKPTGSEARFFVFSFGGETGIVETENGNVNTDNVEIYDLSGRRIVKAQKGIFIVNGKKVIR